MPIIPGNMETNGTSFGPLSGSQETRLDNLTTEGSVPSGRDYVANGSCRDPGKVLTLKTTSPYILGFQKLEDLARGPIVKRAVSLEQDLAKQKESQQLNFDEIIKMSLGDAHAMGQKPITFIRQVLALISCPDLIDACNFKDDVKKKAKEILGSCLGGSVGAYSESRGMLLIRKHVAKYIEQRDDGVPSTPEDIVLTAGASDGIKTCLKLMKSGESSQIKKAGVLIPVPEYPLYSAALEANDMPKIPYYLQEHKSGWTVDVGELETLVHNARNYCEPRAIVVINPGNPTGHVLTREAMKKIVRLAYQQRLVIMADEVYQHNVNVPQRFHSFKKVLSEMAPPFNSVELISFHSCSKGYAGECGLRGGYFEVTNMDPGVKSVLIASVVSNLCPTVLGQAVIDCLVDPPKPGDPSFDQYSAEKLAILKEIADRAETVYNELNAIPGISCAPVDGAMYAFPQIHLSERAMKAATDASQEPDVFYCMNLLNATGICVLPGCCLGQAPGTYHFRTTLLAPTNKMKMLLQKLRHFHLDFMKEYL